MATATVTATWKKDNLKIQPCILVVDTLRVARGVSYHRRDLDVQGNPDGSEVATWETERHYKNKDEAKEADQVYSNARYKIRSKCLYTEVGYICPAGNEDELRKAVDEAREMCDEFNRRAKYCHIVFRVLCTRIETDNNDGIDAIKDTLTRNVDELKKALQEFDYKRARNVLVATKPSVDILANGVAKKSLLEVRETAKALAGEIAELVKEQDGVENAMVSENGQKLLRRAKAKWNF